MPLTLPTHPIAVVPLKLWRPRWFDGVALTIGAIAPDIGYAVESYGATVHSHAWHAALWWAVPVTLVGARLVRWSAPTVAAHLPAGGPFGFRDYGVLGLVRHRWPVTAMSAVIGAASHIAWDAFTHPYVDGPRVLFPWLHNQVWPGVPWWDLLSDGSDLIGIIVGTGLAVHIGRCRLLRRWHGPPPVTAARPAVYWSVFVLVLAIGLAALPLRPAQLLPDQAIRVMLLTGLALVAATFVVRWRAARQHSRMPPQPMSRHPAASG